ncbi:hypothetical protein FQN60_011098 [Etheostoma spectabile]|uniref:G-protein coupled receptors family 1 profile domain-containing protein n=1 Tax=Etheostoma spectabile TaxID=54343 RepID=A0A5J5DQT3_9PERO|nr:hypothetical protein FQN60_011098 [Etheostoma spectabile]
MTADHAVRGSQRKDNITAVRGIVVAADAVPLCHGQSVEGNGGRLLSVWDAAMGTVPPQYDQQNYDDQKEDRTATDNPHEQSRLRVTATANATGLWRSLDLGFGCLGGNLVGDSWRVEGQSSSRKFQRLSYFALELLQWTDSRVTARHELMMASRITAPQLHGILPITGINRRSTAARVPAPEDAAVSGQLLCEISQSKANANMLETAGCNRCCCMSTLVKSQDNNRIGAVVRNPNTTSSWQDDAGRGVQMAATLLIFLVGVPLNGLVVWALGMRHNRHLRCLCLLRPLWARLRRPSWAVPLACGILWLIATIFSAPYLYTASLMEHNGTYQCLESGKFDMALFVTETIAGFILPLLVFLGSNLAVLLTIQQAVLPSSPSSFTPSTARRMTRMYHVLFFTMLLFLTCWVPYFFCRFLLALAEERAEWATLNKRASHGKYISLYLVYIKCALNPVLYVFAARGLGRAIKASLVSTIERLFNDDSIESIRRKSLKNSVKNSQM